MDGRQLDPLVIEDTNNNQLDKHPAMINNLQADPLVVQQANDNHPIAEPVNQIDELIELLPPQQPLANI